MALRKLNSFAEGDVNLSSLMECVNKLFWKECTLTEFKTSSRPELAAGSVIDCNGSLFYADRDEAITGTPSDGLTYAYVLTNGETATLVFTNTEPVWDDNLQGWYSNDSNLYRYLPFAMTYDSGDFYDKYRLERNLLNVGRRGSDSAVLHEDVPVFGYMNDGTPLYAKEVSLTIPNSVYSNTVAHGITNAATNNRIVDVRTRRYCPGEITHVTYAVGEGTRYAGYPTSPSTYSGWDDTYLRVARGDASGDKTYVSFIIFKG